MSDENKELISELVKISCLPADIQVIQFQGTPAQKTELAIRTALEFMVGNGLITIVPEEQWPFFLAIDPPYSQDREKENRE